MTDTWTSRMLVAMGREVRRYFEKKTGFKEINNESEVITLPKSFYGLKQSGR